MAKILIIDDDQAVLKMIREKLAPFYEIADTSKPEEALALALQIKPDCILLDLLMPKFSDSNFARRSFHLAIHKTSPSSSSAESPPLATKLFAEAWAHLDISRNQ